MFQIDCQSLEIILLEYVYQFCLPIWARGDIEEVDKVKGGSTKTNKGEGGKNGPKWVDVYCEWSLLKIALLTDLGFRYATLFCLKILFKHIFVKKLTYFSIVPMYIGTSPSIKIAVTHECHLWKSVSLLFLFFINFY